MLFEKLVEKFPTCGRFWRIYIEQEVSLHDTYIEYNVIAIAGHLLEHQLVRILPIESLHAVSSVIEPLHCGNVVAHVKQFCEEMRWHVEGCYSYCMPFSPSLTDESTEL